MSVHSGFSSQVVLASASPRRKKLLREIITSFKVIHPLVEEDIFTPAIINPFQYVKHLAKAKTLNVASWLKIGIVIGADTIVYAGGEIIGKPKTRASSIAILKKLSGKRQNIITGVCIINTNNGKSACDYESTTVYMKKLSLKEIIKLAYSKRHYNKAGGYAIQEQGDKYIKVIKGNMDNAVGLPLTLVKRLLKQVLKPSK
jgi:septum formation protein